MEKCDKAVMDFLAATDVGKFPPKTGGGVRAGGLSLISSLFPLYAIDRFSDAFFCQKGTTSTRSGAPPSSRPAQSGGVKGCHTLSRVDTV